MNRFPTVVTVILTWNKRDILVEGVRSVLAMDYPANRVLVVDNASSDGSADAIRTIFPDVRVIQNDQNYGAIQGKNVGFREALQSRPDYVFALDNDLVADPSALGEMVKLAESDPVIGLVGAKIYDYEEKDLILSAGSKIDYTENVLRQYGRGERDRGQFDRVMSVDHVGMGHVLIRHSVFEAIGLLDEGYVGYGYEDVDYCVRATKAGFQILYCPTAKVWHRPHSGVGVYSFRKKYLESRNAVRFMKQHAPFAGWVKYLFFAFAGLFYAFVREGARGHLGGVWGKARGLVDGLVGNDKMVYKLMNLKLPSKRSAVSGQRSGN
jgi:GT2 family glycosyltransferase